MTQDKSFVDPSGECVTSDDVADVLIKYALPSYRARTLAEWLLSTGCIPDDHRAVNAVEAMCERLELDNEVSKNRPVSYRSRQIASWIKEQSIAPIPGWFLKKPIEPWRPTKEAAEQFYRKVEERFGTGPKTIDADTREPANTWSEADFDLHERLPLARRKYAEGVLHIEDHLDFAVLEPWMPTMSLRKSAPTFSQGELHWTRTDSPLFWLMIDPVRVVDLAVQWVVAGNRDERFQRAATLFCHFAPSQLYDLRLFEDLVSDFWKDSQAVENFGRFMQKAILKWCDSWIGEDVKAASDLERGLLLVMAIEASRGFVADLPEELRTRLDLAADREFGLFRAKLRDAAPAEAADLLNDRSEVLGCAHHVMTELNPTFQSLKPLLLILRVLPAPAVMPDMNCWGSEQYNRTAIEPWCLIPQKLVDGLHHVAGWCQPDDETLVDLRTEFAQFCLDRLTTSKKALKASKRTGPLVENDPKWRLAYVKAASALRINPSGDGHHILHHAWQHDPDASVKQAAQKAYQPMREGRNLPHGRSPRRAVVEALLWLLQAQYLTTSPKDWPQIDQKGIWQTREHMVRRTTEAAQQARDMPRPKGEHAAT